MTAASWRSASAAGVSVPRRSMKSVVVSPSRKAAERNAAARKSRLVIDAAEVQALERERQPPGRLAAGAVRGRSPWRASDRSRRRPPSRARRPSPSRTSGWSAGSNAASVPGGGKEPCGRIFGVEASLDGVPREGDVGLVVAEGFARGDAQLLAHEVDAGDLLGDRVLDLEAGVHLEEEELAGTRRRRRNSTVPADS